MPQRILLEKECDYSIKTHVSLGKRIKDVPTGWALNLYDIREFIPILRYELECYIKIKSIIAPCKIRINPRLFYKGKPLKNHLRKVKSVDADKKIPIEIKFNKEKLSKVHEEFGVVSLNYIDTRLHVGKSYRSKGWGLKKDVVSKLLPLNAYDYVFPVYIDEIPAETRLNMQTRLFYNSNELSQELERLNKIDPDLEIEARIILNEEYLEITESSKDDHLSDRTCILCGNFIDEDSKSDKCYDCSDKEITVLKLKKLLDFINPSETFFKEDLLDLGYTQGQINIMIYKFNKYGLVSINWDESFQFKDKNTLDNFIKQWG